LHAEFGPYVDRANGPCLACMLAANPDPEPLAPAATDTPPPVQTLGLGPTLAAGATSSDDVRPPVQTLGLGPTLAAGAPSSDDAGAGGAGGDAASGALLVGAAMIAAQIVGLVSRATPVLLPVRWARVDLRRLTLSQRSGVTRPGCPNCSAAPGAKLRPASIASRYDAAVALPPKSFVDIKAHQAHYQPANMALQRKHKTWPLAPRVALPTLDLGLLTGTAAAALAASAIGSRTSAAGVGGGATGGPRRDRVSLPEMGLLLGVTAGWRNDEVTERRPERVFRWTASGGNIGSVVA
jgi:hypothetical protein